MKKEEIEAYLKEKQGADVYFYPEWGAIRADIEGKMFAMIAQNKESIPIVTLKGTVEMNEIYRKQYNDIVPGYYMNKQHWNSIYYEKNTVPSELLKQMIDDAYQLIFDKLPKKIKEKYQ